MQDSGLPQTNDVVLIGGGHTHALVLRKWGMSPIAGARLTVIDPGPTTAYSGMLPGHVAGHYTRADLDIDLVRLARFAGARLIIGAADWIDLAQRRVTIPGRPPVGFDLCSVDVGITSKMPDLPGFASHGVPAKPLGPFAGRWARFLDQPGPAHAVVIGAGVAGAELAMAMAYGLAKKGHAGGVTLVDSAGALASTGPRARARLRRALAGLNVTVIENATITGVTKDQVQLADGRTLAANFVTGAAGARPQSWPATTGLVTQDGFLAVDAYLRTSDPAVFATGDCAHLIESPRPKAGVFAVREAPILFHNLRAALTGDKPRRYRPQKDYLKLISLGQKSALAERFGLTLAGPLLWRWKNHIDQTFMDRFRDLPAMEAAPLPPLYTRALPAALGDKPMCGGCGAKLGQGTLMAALGAPGLTGRRDIVALPGDDAALLRTGGVDQVMTTDHLRALTNDPALMTRIAAIHALGDIWAMGAAPQAATATLILPRQTDPMAARMLAEIMTTAREVLGDAGAELVGGHTSLGEELTVGFTLTGLCAHPPITLGGGMAGDALILTKPIGSGVIMAAEMQMKAKGGWVQAAFAQMVSPQSRASEILKEAHAMTDVTGFGLIGHLLNICTASGTGAALDPEAVPLMDGALDLARTGLRSTIFPQNRAAAPDLPETPLMDLMFDPQTAGGLLAAVAPSAADEMLTRLRDAGYPAARIGYLTKGAARIAVLDR